jgi:hypothetical protein
MLPEAGDTPHEALAVLRAHAGGAAGLSACALIHSGHRAHPGGGENLTNPEDVLPSVQNIKWKNAIIGIIIVAAAFSAVFAIAWVLTHLG